MHQSSRANLADGVTVARRTGIVANAYRDDPWFRNEFWVGNRLQPHCIASKLSRDG
jgi:hypothetical protein